MRKLSLLIAGLFLATFAWSQSNKEEIDLVQAAFGMEKKEVVASFIKVSATQKDAFWKLYDEYETERKELGKQRINLLAVYAKEYLTMTVTQADEWTKNVIELQKKTDALIVTYYGKVKAISDGLVATQFYQIENYILTAIRMEILKEVPFVYKP
jgi:hypothetical protein